jgi:hypothetical protein
MKKLKINAANKYTILFYLYFFCQTIAFANYDLPLEANNKPLVNGLIIYLEIATIPGSYNFPGLSGAENAMEINTYSFNETNAVELNNSSLLSSKAVPPSFLFKSMTMDKVIIGLYGKLMARTSIPEVKVQVYYFNGSTYKHIEEIILEGVFIEGIDAQAENGNTTGIVHDVTMKYQKIKKTIFAYNAGGVATPSLNSIMTWDYTTNTP